MNFLQALKLYKDGHVKYLCYRNGADSLTAIDIGEGRSAMFTLRTQINGKAGNVYYTLNQLLSDDWGVRIDDHSSAVFVFNGESEFIPTARRIKIRG